MAPRKKASSASSARKSSQSVRQSQPAKFGIQHFFERHSQATTALAISELANSPVDLESGFDQCGPPKAEIPPEKEDPSPISPEVSKSFSHKRARFSPGMFLKQSQDDGVDEVTWKISPVNQKLRFLTTKSLQEDVSSHSACLKHSLSTLRSCSEVKISDKRVPSPTTSNAEASEKLQKYGCIENVDTNMITAEPQAPFRTPPSTSYGPLESVAEGSCKGASTELGSTVYRKALLELLDQVEDEISIDSSTDEPKKHVTESDAYGASKDNVCSNVHHKSHVNKLTEVDHNAHRSQNLLVLEVMEEHSSSDLSLGGKPLKILRLLNESSGEEQVLHLCDDWFYSNIQPGDTINAIGQFDEHGRCTINRNHNLLIVHPHILLSGTRVASSFTCSRRTVLDERLKLSEHSTSALIGTLLHQVFQAGLLKDCPTTTFLEEYAGTLLHKNAESLYACGVSENDTYVKLIRQIPRILKWIEVFRDEKGSDKPMVDFGQCDGERSVAISEVMDIEEMAHAPRYGLKGMIDASLLVKIGSFDGELNYKIVPFELKTGKSTTGQAAMEHRAQVILYTLLMSDRYRNNNVDSGLLYYLHTDQTLGIKVQRSDLIGIIMRRNELATEILKASSSQILPPMLRCAPICKNCRHLNTCTVYHKANGGDRESSGLDELFDSLVNHLTLSHGAFLQHWDRLIDLESKVKHHGNLSSFLLDISRECSVDDSSRNRRYVYHFTNKNIRSEEGNGRKNITDCGLRCGDYVVALPRRLRLPGIKHSLDETALAHESWRIDKDEFSSSYASMRFNLVQLFLQSEESSHLRKMIVDLEAPMFDSGSTVSQDPAMAYVRSETSLNDDQRKAIHKILCAKDYSLILGMPGTGKTSTMVHAVKALLIRGASVLLTSYTNSAVDNLLVKLKTQGIDFIRIGRQEAVHISIREHCFSGKQSLEEVKQRIENVRVVGVTCLGINHPLLAKRKFDICIMDEAGQTALPVSLGPLMFAKKFALVGDHYQLPPLVQSAEAQENGMGISLFCRLSEAHPQAIAALQSQYRMCAGIMELSNALIYGNRLRCGSLEIANAKMKFSCTQPLSSWLKEVLDPEKPVIFINTDKLPALEVKAQKTLSNPTEANLIAEIVEELINKEVSGCDLGIITPYNAQVDLIRSLLQPGVEVHTIDRYQGRDKDCILISFVRSTEKSTHFGTSLLGDWHRINVALTRPKKKLVMVGSCGTLSRIPLLKLLIEKVCQQGGLLTPSQQDIRQRKLFQRCSHG